MQEDKSRSKDLLARVEREKQLEAESHALKYQVKILWLKDFVIKNMSFKN